MTTPDTYLTRCSLDATLFDHIHMLSLVHRDFEKSISLLPCFDIYQHRMQLHEEDMVNPSGDILDEKFIFVPKTSKGA